MNAHTFTVEQINFLCIFDTGTRMDCIEDIQFSSQYFDDPEMRDIADNTLAVLQRMTDDEFTSIQLCPAYYNDEED